MALQGIQIAQRVYWELQPSAPSTRVLWDATVTQILAGIYEPDARTPERPPESLYGNPRMWADLQ